MLAVLGKDMVLLQGKVCASFEMGKALTKKCWCVVREMHRCRYMGGNETPAEKWVGLLKLLWDPVQGPCTQRIIAQLKLRAAGIRADGVDDPFVRGVAGCISGTPTVHSGLGPTMEKYVEVRGAAFRIARARPPSTIQPPLVPRSMTNWLKAARELEQKKYSPSFLPQHEQDLLAVARREKHGFKLPFAPGRTREAEHKLMRLCNRTEFKRKQVARRHPLTQGLPAGGKRRPKPAKTRGADAPKVKAAVAPAAAKQAARPASGTSVAAKRAATAAVAPAVAKQAARPTSGTSVAAKRARDPSIAKQTATPSSSSSAAARPAEYLDKLRREMADRSAPEKSKKRKIRVCKCGVYSCVKCFPN